MRVIFAGTPDFAATHLQAILEDDRYQLVAIYTQPDRPAGRGKKITQSPVKKLALANNRKIRLPGVPSVVVKLIYGELANILLEGVKVNNSKITEAGFTFKYKTIDAAFKRLFS